MRHFLDLYLKKGMPSPFSLKTWQEVQIDELRKHILQLHLYYFDARTAGHIYAITIWHVLKVANLRLAVHESAS